MNINQKVYDLVSNKDIAFLFELNHKLKINKNGKFKYFKMNNFELDDVKNFLNNLDHDKIFTLIPFISINGRSDEPFIILSQQILITRDSTPVLLTNFIDTKINKTFELFNSNNDISYYTIFKYKSIEIDYKSINNFN
jgi:hypothetical protein